ncbi:MAG: AAA family ATPase [Candidatus Brocadiales bacterium]|nr:AAA family ATPase [Candidatus Brocadiales bacterium]
MKIIDYSSRLSFVSEMNFKSIVNDQIEISTVGNSKFTVEWDLFKLLVDSAEDVSKYDLIETGYINLNNLTCSHALPIKIVYSKQPFIIFKGKKHIVFRYVDYTTSELFLPYYNFGKFIGDEPTLTPLNSDNILLLESSTFYSRLFNEDHNFRASQSVYSKTRLPSEIENSVSFSSLYYLIERSVKPTIVAGKAGSGKSSFLRYFRARKENSVLLSPTGVSALNTFGETIHSFFELPLTALAPDSFDLVRKPKYKNLAILLIDEISMVRADVLDAIDKILKYNKNPALPFGGTMVVFSGDVAQLPPIVENDIGLREYFKTHYPSEWFFDAHVFSEEFVVHELEKSFRHVNDNEIALLNRLRYATHTAEDIEHLNKRCYHDADHPSDAITLTTTNHYAQRINQVMIDKIQAKEYAFEAVTSGVYNTKTDHVPTDHVLRLKIGTQVMLLKNDSVSRWVNGSIGKVIDLESDRVIIRVSGSEYELGRAVWTKYKYEYDKETDKLVQINIGEFEQFPIKPAWAITIHKSQGLTLDRIILDIGSGMFAPGQLYVALSRCKNLDDIRFSKPISQRDIIVDPRMLRFAHEYGI